MAATSPRPPEHCESRRGRSEGGSSGQSPRRPCRGRAALGRRGERPQAVQRGVSHVAERADASETNVLWELCPPPSSLLPPTLCSIPPLAGLPVLPVCSSALSAHARVCVRVIPVRAGRLGCTSGPEWGSLCACISLVRFVCACVSTHLDAGVAVSRGSVPWAWVCREVGGGRGGVHRKRC